MFSFTSMPSPGEREKAAVRALEAACNAFDGTHFETFLSNQFNVRPEMDAFFFCWQEGTLAGCLSLYADEEREAEVTAMVHPEARGQGVFRALLAHAAAAAAPCGPVCFTFKTDAAFPQAEALAARWGARLRSEEYLMTASRRTAHAALLPGLAVGPAREDELETLTDIEQEAFGGTRAEAARYIRGSYAGKEQALLAARLHGVPVGCASADLAGRWAYLYGVCVAAAHRGKGVGTGLLRGALEALAPLTPKRPALSVETDNAPALRLYTAAGFARAATLRYYTLGPQWVRGRAGL